jgi:hypothetical protein
MSEDYIGGNRETDIKDGRDGYWTYPSIQCCGLCPEHLEHDHYREARRAEKQYDEHERPVETDEHNLGIEPKRSIQHQFDDPA